MTPSYRGELSHRDMLRQLLPGHTYVLYSDELVTLENISSAVYQFNPREGKKWNLWLHKRITNIKISAKMVMKRMEVAVFTFDDHINGKDKNWIENIYTHEEY